jgi:hypothetical protein
MMLRTLGARCAVSTPQLFQPEGSLMKRIAFLFVLAAAAFAGRGASAVTSSLNLPIDTSWRAIGPVGDLTGNGIDNVGLAWEASHPGWNVPGAFDDSDAAGWGNAIAVIHPNQPFLRYWVDGTETVGSSPAYFRRQFTIPGVPLNGLLDFGVDDDAKVYVNGQLVFTDNNSLATSFDNLNVTAHLKSGLNLIAVKAQDQQGAQSISGQLDVTYMVPEPSSLAMGALACLLIRRRRTKSRCVPCPRPYLGRNNAA